MSPNRVQGADIRVPEPVIPAQAGIHAEHPVTLPMDRVGGPSRVRGNDRVEQIWGWLAEVADPEIPVISVVDLGIVRDVQVADDGACTVTITPTYSGCPAMQVIADAVTDALRERGIERVTLRTQLSPAWTTDWMSEEGKVKLKGYGIAPPAQQVIDISGLRKGNDLAAGVKRGAIAKPKVVCPHCGSSHTENTSQFGSTPCKALYKCLDCREPFDYFKCH